MMPHNWRVLQGATRHVLLTDRWAIKVPRVTAGYRSFLHGLLANHQEALFSNMSPSLCPVRLGLPLGLLVVMPRCESLAQGMSDGEYEAFVTHEHYVLPVENKRDSFGVLNGNIVAVDYGS